MSKVKETKEDKKMSESQAYSLISELFGDDSLVHPDMITKAEVIKTRSPSLDRAIGVGGWPRGRIIQLAGKESSGKTFMALQSMAEWQSLDPENCCAFIDAEYTYDPKWASSFGIDNKRVLLIKTNEAAKIFTGLIGRIKKNQVTHKITKIPGLLDMIANGETISHKYEGSNYTLNLGKMGVIVLDSIANLQVPMEMESEVGKQNMAAIARFLTVELRKLTPAVADANVVFIGINQVRAKIGEMFGNPEDTPGGKALKHACSLMIEVTPMTGADNIILDSNEEKIGHRVRAKITKNKLGNPARKAEFLVNFKHGVIDSEYELLDVGIMIGAVKRPNNLSYEINGEKFKGRDSAAQYLKDNFKKIENDFREIYISGKDEDLSIYQSDPKSVSDSEELFNSTDEE